MRIPANKRVCSVLLAAAYSASLTVKVPLSESFKPMADKSVGSDKVPPVMLVMGSIKPEVSWRIMLDTPKSLFKIPRGATSMLEAVCCL